MFNSFQTMEGKKIQIHDGHQCRATAMTPQELLKYLKNEGDSTHTAISIYIAIINTFNQGHARQNPSKKNRFRGRGKGRGGGGEGGRGRGGGGGG